MSHAHSYMTCKILYCDMAEGKKGFQVGHETYGHRQRGTYKTPTAELRAMMRDAAVDMFPDFIAHLQNLESKDFCKTYLDMCNYVVPKIRSLPLDEDGNVTSAMEHLKLTAEWQKKE